MMGGGRAAAAAAAADLILDMDLLGDEPEEEPQTKTVNTPQAQTPTPSSKRPRQSEEGGATAETYSSTTWASRLREVLSCYKRAEQQRPIRLSSLCSGMSTESYAVQVRTHGLQSKKLDTRVSESKFRRSASLNSRQL